MAEASLKPLVFFQKPAIGSKASDATPVQIIFPSGNFGIGIAHVEGGNQAPNPANDLENSVLASGPENSPIDQREILGLKVAFICLGVTNVIITSIMYFDARNVNPSNVVRDPSGLPQMYDIVDSERSGAEDAYYTFSLLIILMGMASSLFNHPLGLSAYSLGIMLLFFLGSASLPYFAFSARYIFDIFMLYLALVQRSRLIYTFLPLSHFHAN